MFIFVNIFKGFSVSLLYIYVYISDKVIFRQFDKKTFCTLFLKNMLVSSVSLLYIFFSLLFPSSHFNVVECTEKVEKQGIQQTFDNTLINNVKYFILFAHTLAFLLVFKLKNFMKMRNSYDLSTLSFFSSFIFALLHLIGSINLFKDSAYSMKYMAHVEQTVAKPHLMLFCFTILKCVESINCIILVLQKKQYGKTAFNLASNVFLFFLLGYLPPLFFYPILFLFFNLSFLSYFLRTLSFLMNENNKVCFEIKRMIIIAKLFHVVLCAMLSVQNMYAAENNQHLLYWTSQLMAIFSLYYVFINMSSYLRHFHVNMRSNMASFLILFHIFAVVGLVKAYYHPSFYTVLSQAIFLYILSGFGITVGAHRLWSHRSYHASKSFRILIMILNSLANQGTIYHWSRDHRCHHKYSECLGDPHNAKRGFFFSHMGWLLLKKDKDVIESGKTIDCSDLLLDEVVVFQMKYDPYWNQFWCFLVPSLLGYYFYNDFWLGFFAFGALRWVMCLHATWTVNSVAHLWGDRPYNPNINPAESLLTSVLAVGEGWHNWHHVYPFDYATSEGGMFSHYNPSKLLIDVAAYFGFVWDRKRATHIWEAEKLRRLKEMEKTVAETLKNNENSSKQTIISSLPPQFTKKSLIRATLNLCRDLLICFSIAVIAIYIRSSAVGKFCSQTYLVNQSVNFLLWTIYALAQGTVAFGVWVLGYEASGGRFSDYQIINHAIGLILHSAILIPYRSIRANKERKRASLIKRLSEDAFAILKIPSWKSSFCGSVSAVSVFMLCAIFAYVYGVRRVAKWYFGPWIVLNLWLLLYHWLLDNGPQDSVELDMNKSCIEYFTREWLKDIWPKVTRGRKYPWNKLFDHLHHHLCLSHIIQAVDFNVPHYHLLEAFRRLGDLLYEFGEIVDAKSQICQHVEDVSINKIMKHSIKYSTIASVTSANTKID